jgi:tRNA threonylcarbamoyladenosine biosynthesis protein TsaB
MLLLAIDTATRRVGVAFGNADGLLGAVAIGGPGASGPPRHTEQLAPAIDYLCRETGVGLQSLSAVAVGIGPGMFTGLRAGVVTARTIALTLGVPIVAVPSLDLLAYPLRSTSRALVVPVIDARRNEVYYALYQPVPGGVQRVSDYALGTPADVAGELAARGATSLLCGDGALRFRAEFAGTEGVDITGPANASPSLASLVELAAARFEREEFVPPNEVVPLYLRRSDAEIAAGERKS